MICPLTLEQDPRPRMRAGGTAAGIGGRGKERAVSPDMTALSDGALVLAWQRGDNEALRALVDRHRAAAFGLALRLCGNRDRAEDLAQDAFLRALSKIGRYNTDLPFRPWLFRILGRLFIDQVRVGGATVEACPDAPTGGNPDSDLFVQGLLATLSPQQRAILVLRELAGLSYEELALYFHVPIGTVRSRLAHARIALKDAYLRLTKEVAQ